MRLALAQINPTIGDIDGNAEIIRRFIDAARRQKADLVVLPELCLSGYPPKDLLLQEGFIEAVTAAARDIGEKHTAGITAVFGAPLPLDPGQPRGPIANALVAYRDNTYVDRYDKRLLPTYDVFDEDRYFRSGARAVVIDVAGVPVGLSVCEDLWKGEDAGFASRYFGAPDPVAELVAAGARVIINPSASPFVLGKGQKHRKILRDHAVRHGVYVAAVNQVGGNDELIFDGHAAVYDPAGRLIAAGPGFGEDVLVCDIPSGSRSTGLPTPSPDVADPLLSAPTEQLLFHALVLGIRDYCRKTGFKSAIVGLSGGIDSALVGTLAAAALGPTNVLGLAMPGKYSSDHSRRDAYELARRLGMPCQTIPIDPPFDGFRGVLDAAFKERHGRTLGASLPDITEENLQSRIRGTILMGVSNRSGSIVLTTGNKSELAVGYCTLYGDMNGGLAVLSDVSKMQVYALSRWINANHHACGFDRPPIPEPSITKAPSAELRPNQTDQDSLPPYDVLDQIIERYIERHESPAHIAAQTGIDAATIARTIRMIDNSEYKRKQLATGLKVTTVAFGFGRRFPIAQGWKPR